MEPSHFTSSTALDNKISDESHIENESSQNQCKSAQPQMRLQEFHGFLGVGKQYGNHVGGSKSGAKDSVISHVDKDTERQISNQQEVESPKDSSSFMAE